MKAQHHLNKRSAGCSYFFILGARFWDPLPMQGGTLFSGHFRCPIPSRGPHGRRTCESESGRRGKNKKTRMANWPTDGIPMGPACSSVDLTLFFSEHDPAGFGEDEWPGTTQGTRPR